MSDCVLITNLRTVITALPHGWLILSCDALTLMKCWNGTNSAWCVEGWSSSFQREDENDGWEGKLIFAFWPDSGDCIVAPHELGVVQKITIGTEALVLHAAEVAAPWRPLDVVRCAHGELSRIIGERTRYYEKRSWRRQFTVTPV